MRRILLLLLGVVAFTWLEFEFFPGHTYLESGTQLYLPMLEHFDAPGYLSRDFVATHPVLTYTIYDEVTLFLHEAVRLDFKTALISQQVLCRAAAISGVFLLAASTGLSDVFAFLIAALVNLGATLIGPSVRLVEQEPVPSALAIGLVLLAAGLLAREKPLLAGLAGGIAFVYQPALAAPFWLVVLAALILDPKLRRLLRPALTILIVFALLLANLAQLQPGVLEWQPIWGKLSQSLAQLQQFRIPQVWVSLWASREIWNYLAICMCGLWAAARTWPTLNRQTRWLLTALPLCGILSVPVSDLLVEHLRFSVAPELQVARTLVFTVGFSSIACGVAGAQSMIARKKLEASLWFLAVLALPMQVRIFELLRWIEFRNLLELGLAIVLSSALVLPSTRFRGTVPGKAVMLLVPIAAIFVMPVIGGVEHHSQLDRQPVLDLASWAEQSTWGSSTFLFPDAGRQSYPGLFRAFSRRALWVDWKSGDLVCCFDSVASVWWDRWRQTMDGGFSRRRLESMLPLPIDYYVLKRSNALSVRPVFVNSEFVVYDARDLRNARDPLQ